MFHQIKKLLALTKDTIYFFIYKICNIKKKKILLYTDSRGYNILENDYKSSIQNTYAWYLIKKYNITCKICNYKHTSLIDFIYDYEVKNIKKNYDKIILHCGIVDFSPRNLSQRNKIIEKKIDKLKKIFPENYKEFQQPHVYIEKYEGEYTSSLINENTISMISDKISNIKNLIWINSNFIIDDWDGNYWKKRPKNMNNILKLQNQLKLDNIIDISEFEETKIKLYTIDNIHFNKKGMNYLFKKIDEQINYI